MGKIENVQYPVLVIQNWAKRKRIPEVPVKTYFTRYFMRVNLFSIKISFLSKFVHMYFHKISQPKGLLLTSFTKICLELHLLLLLLLLLLSHFSRVRLCATPETAAHQAPPSLGFSRQEHWSGLPFPSPMHESEK